MGFDVLILHSAVAHRKYDTDLDGFTVTKVFLLSRKMLNLAQ